MTTLKHIHFCVQFELNEPSAIEVESGDQADKLLQMYIEYDFWRHPANFTVYEPMEWKGQHINHSIAFELIYPRSMECRSDSLVQVKLGWECMRYIFDPEPDWSLSVWSLGECSRRIKVSKIKKLVNYLPIFSC